MKKVKLLLVFILVSSSFYSKSVEDGFEALKIYNYFEAKRIFQNKVKKTPSPAAYGLATIYFRKDNPFHQLDSAYKYITIASDNFPKTDDKTKSKLLSYNFSELAIFELKLKISSSFFESCIKENTEEAYQLFLSKHPWANERFIAIQKRDSLAFQKVMKENNIQALNEFNRRYPESFYKAKVEQLIEQKIYLEAIQNKTLDEYLHFIENHPNSSFKNEAENEIFLMQTSTKTLSSFYQFIKNFPSNHNVALAWKKLFQTYMYQYSENRITNFIQEYPEYPFKEDIELELLYTKTNVYPYKKDKYFGLTTEDGKIVSPAIYDWINPFREGLAMASKNGKIGFINKDNKVIIRFEYNEAVDFEEGRAIVTKGDKSGILDRSGNVIFPCIFKEIGSYSEGLVFAKKDSLFAYYDQYGTQIIQERFTEAFEFRNGLAHIIMDGYENYTDRLGNLIFPLQYERISQLTDNLFLFQKGEYLGLINKNLAIIQEAKYDEIGTLSDNKIIFTLNGKLGYFDRFGNVEIAPIFDVYANFLKEACFNNNMAKVKFKGKFGVINQFGNWVIPAQFQFIGEPATIIPFYKDLLWGFIDIQNKILIQPTYEEAKCLDNEMAIVSFSEKYGLIDFKGNILIPIEYESVRKLDDNLFACQLNGEIKLVDKSNKAVSNTIYTNIITAEKDLLILVNEIDLHYYSIPENRLIRPSINE